jgi:hypothetical protein
MVADANRRFGRLPAPENVTSCGDMWRFPACKFVLGTGTAMRRHAGCQQRDTPRSQKTFGQADRQCEARFGSTRQENERCPQCAGSRRNCRTTVRACLSSGSPRHRQTDQVFIVVDAEPGIDSRDGAVTLAHTRTFVGPTANEHTPFAAIEVRRMLITPRGVRNSGGDGSDRSRSPTCTWVPRPCTTSARQS